MQNNRRGKRHYYMLEYRSIWYFTSKNSPSIFVFDYGGYIPTWDEARNKTKSKKDRFKFHIFAVTEIMQDDLL